MNQADAERIVAQIASGKEPFTAPGKSLTDPTLNPEANAAAPMNPMPGDVRPKSLSEKYDPSTTR
jgi:hypothetical protein